MLETAMITEMPTSEELAGMATERSGLYRLLAAVFRDELSEELLDQILSSEFLEKMSDAGLDTPSLASMGKGMDLKKKLSIEYSRLFVGPGKHVAPYESVHMGGDGGSLWGKETVIVKRFIEQCGFSFEENYQDLPDHISVELEFMAQLTALEAKFWQGGAKKKALNCLNFQKSFMEKHLGLWVEIFCGKVDKLAEYPFYPQMAKLMTSFVKEEMNEFKSFTLK